MNCPRCFAAVLWIGLFAARLGVCGEEPPKKSPTEAQIARAIERLGDPSYAVREQAGEWLWGVGDPAVPALEKAVSNPDLEIAYRAVKLLDKMRWGLSANTPSEVVELTEKFRSGDSSLRQQIARDLIGKSRMELLQRLVAASEDPDLKAWVDKELGQIYARAVPDHIAHGDEFGVAEKTLAEAPLPAQMADYAALLAVRGKLEPAIERLRSDLAKTPDSIGELRLAHLLRAKGDFAPAIEIVRRRAPDSQLFYSLLHDAGEWAELAKKIHERSEKSGEPIEGQIEPLGFLAAYSRLSGDKAGLQKAVEAIEKHGQDKPEELWFCMEALLINDRPEEAIRLAADKRPFLAFDLCRATSRFSEAFKVVGVDQSTSLADWFVDLSQKGGTEEVRDPLGMAAGVVRLLYVVGEQDRAKALLRAMADHAGRAGAPERVSDLGLLIRTEMAIGETDAALSRAATALDGKKVPSGQLFESVFRRSRTLCDVFWLAIREQHPGETERENFKRFVAFFRPSSDDVSEREWREVVRLTAAKNPGPGELAWRLDLVKVLFERRQISLAVEEAVKLIKTSSNPTQLVEAAKILAAGKQYPEAEEALDMAERYSTPVASARCLRAFCVRQKGGYERAAWLRRTSLAMPLGNAHSRYELAKLLRELGQTEEAERQCRIAVFTGWPSDWAVSECRKEVGNAAARRGDLIASADHLERFRMLCLQKSAAFNDVESYFKISELIHRNRGLGLLKAGKKEAAIAEFRIAEKMLPGGSLLPTEVVPELERAGLKAEADGFYGRFKNLFESLCRDYPRSPLFHNDLAWTAALLDRDLDMALEHAQRAVALSPSRAAYADTLAEVHFRRGNREEAVRLQKRAVELDPNNPEYKKRLEEFQTGKRYRRD